MKKKITSLKDYFYAFGPTPGKVLLHSCCAPCTGAIVEELQKCNMQFAIYFYKLDDHTISKIGKDLEERRLQQAADV